MHFLRISIASGFGSGFLPYAPGTWGTALACIVVWLVSISSISHHALWIIILAVVSLFFGQWAVKGLPEEWDHDDSRIVIDEFAGLFTSLIYIPLTGWNIVLSFIVFRFYDIVKPLGIRRLDNSDTSWSVMVDDLLAGVYANLTLQLIILLLTWI